MPDKEVFKNIDHKNKAVAVPLPDRINDIDTKNTLYTNIIDSVENGTTDLNSLNSFTSISQSRDEVYNMLDIMAEDPIISTALSIYTADATETNEKGQIVWAESEDENVLGEVQHLLDQMNVDKNAFNWVYSLVKYGDLYLRLYRNSEYNLDLFSKEDKEKESLNEDLILKVYPKNDHYAEYMEMHKNPAEVFDLQKFGKTVGYIRSHIVAKNVNNNDYGLNNSNLSTLWKYNFNKGDIDVYQATEFVHACLEDNSGRTQEEVSITNINAEDGNHFTYNVKRGQSLLYNSFRIWRELSLLENSVLLNRLTKSAIVRMISVEVGDMEKNDVRALLQRIKSMVEQKSAINVGTSYEDYTNPGPIENTIYVPTHDGKGAITTSEVGGQVDVGDLVDIEYFREKLFGSLGIPKQYLGCLRGSTPILLLNGKTITVEEMFNNLEEYLGKGIMACNEDGSLQPTVITNVALTKPSASFLRIHLDNGKYVDVTEDHKMMLRDGSFIYAKDLEVGDSLMPYYDKIQEGRRWVLDNKSGKYKKQYRVVAESVSDIPKGYQVHHIDERKINDDFDNLVPLSLEDHYKQHVDMLHEKAHKKIAEKRAAGLYAYRDITNGLEYRKINTLIADLPEGWWFEGCPKPEDFGAKISAVMSGKPKNYDCAANFGTDYIEKSKITKAQRQAEGYYDKQYKAQSERCKEHAKNNTGWSSPAAMEKKLARHPENRRSKERYVRCLCCGAVEKIKCNDDWYNEYLNEDLFWFCSKECSALSGKGKLARSYNLYKLANYNIDEYDELRTSGEYGKRDTYFLPETLLERLEFIDDYVPECNHKVVDIEFIDVDEPAYDISVEADCHTFALPCGIFVHNCTDDSTGFNGGTSLALISSQYAKNIKRIQNTFCQAITDAINLMLLDKNLNNYINEFTIKMQAPTTQEEKDRKDNLATSINNIREIMSLVDGIEDQITKLNILKTLLSSAITDVEVITAIQDEIDRLTQEQELGITPDTEGEGDDFGDLGGGSLGGDLGALDMNAEPEEGGSTDMDLGELEGGEEPPEENFLTSNGGQVLNERDNLPSWSQMGMSYTDVK